MYDGLYMLRSGSAIELTHDASRALSGAEAPFFCYFIFAFGAFELKEK